jgi:hypothetical protein
VVPERGMPNSRIMSSPLWRIASTKPQAEKPGEAIQ